MKNVEGFGAFPQGCVFKVGDQNMKRETLIFVLASILLICSPSIQRAEKKNPSLLSQILEKSAEYCKKLEQVSLHFVCHEEIREYIYFLESAPKYPNYLDPNIIDPNYIDNTYVYDYQLIRKGISFR